VSEQAEAQSNGKFTFDATRETQFQETLKKYPTKMAVLLPALWLAQEQNGYITPPIMEYVAGRLELSPVHVYGVAEFYTMYHKKPVGKFHLQLCRTLSCTLCGMENLEQHLADKYDIQPGKTTEDGLFSLELVECLGSCGTAPVMRVNEVYLENLNLGKVDEIIADCKAGKELHEEAMGPH